jgi:hypothetical protein
MRNPRGPLAAGLAALSAAVLLVSCGGGGDAAVPATSQTPAPAEAALRTAQAGELAAYFKSRIVQRSAQGLDGTISGDLLATVTTAGVPPSTVSDTATGGGFAGTQLQEAGVDEDDLIKSDGDFVYTLHPAWYTTGGTTRLRTSLIQADGGLADVTISTLEGDATPTGMYLAAGARRLAVLGEKNSWGEVRPAMLTILPVLSQQLSVQLFDVTQPQPAAAGRIVIDGRKVASRMIGNVLYIASTWTPDLSTYSVPPNTPAGSAERALAGLTSEQLLPKISINGGAAQPLVAESECFLQPANASLNLQLTTITAIDLASPTLERRSRCMAGDSTTLYMSPTSVYLATSRDMWIASVTTQAILPREAAIDIHKFALAGLDIDYRGSGEVAGHLGWDAEKMPYRMSEHNGDLRVVTYTGSTGWGMPVPLTRTAAAPGTQPSPATLTVLREDYAQRRLVKLATLPNAQRPAALGREGEQVYAVHFAGPLAYVVTFRRTDPLYVLDLSNPADPKAVGELTVPGYSDYLYPVADGRLLGVGRAADAQGVAQGLQLSLFDVANPAQPRLVTSALLGGRFSSSALDYSRHGINLLRSGNQVRIALPVRLHYEVEIAQVGGVPKAGLARFTLDTAAGTFTERPMVAASSPSAYLGSERALQTAKATYYLSGDQVVVTRQP